MHWTEPTTKYYRSCVHFVCTWKQLKWIQFYSHNKKLNFDAFDRANREKKTEEEKEAQVERSWHLNLLFGSECVMCITIGSLISAAAAADVAGAFCGPLCSKAAQMISSQLLTRHNEFDQISTSWCTRFYHQRTFAHTFTHRFLLNR